MDMNGKADPYVEVSLRPEGQKKFITSIKTHCLNPTFNETEEFFITPDDMSEKDLVLKVMDSDFPQSDELIGIIRLPLKSLGLSDHAKNFSCLISHDKIRNRHELTALDAAKLNLKISENEEELEALRKEIKEASAQLELARDHNIEMRNDNVALTVENNCLAAEFDAKLSVLHENNENAAWSDPETGQGVELKAPFLRQKSKSYCYLPGMHENQNRIRMRSLQEHDFSKSPTSSLSISPEQSLLTMANFMSGTAHEKCLQNLNVLRQRIVLEDTKIYQLQKYIQTLEPSKMHSRKGTIEVSLSFYHISSRLKISLLSASRLHGSNPNGNSIERRPNPFVKIKIFLRNATAYRSTSNSGTLDKISRRSSVSSCKRNSGGRGKHSYRWTFKTQIAENTSTPAWNEHFEIDEITEDDLPNMYIEITVMDYNQFLPNRPLGKIRIGPGTRDNQHWEEMLTHHGAPVVLTHLLEDI